MDIIRSDFKAMKVNDIKTGFGQRLRQIRKQRGLSQEKLAHLVGLDRSYVGSVERGERNISLINIYQLAKALKVQALELMKF